MEIKSLTNFSELCKMAYEYEKNTLSLEEITEKLTDWYVLGYEAWVDGEIKGFAFSLLVNNLYTLDGYNEGVSIFTAAKMGRMVCKDLFDNYTDRIMTFHFSNQNRLHALVKRIGFKEAMTVGDRIIFEMRKSWAK